jgi:hypothetical protein
MTSGNGTPSRYTVSMSQFQRVRILQFHQEQAAAGRGQRFVEAYREIVRRLQRDPVTRTPACEAKFALHSANF